MMENGVSNACLESCNQAVFVIEVCGQHFDALGTRFMSLRRGGVSRDSAYDVLLAFEEGVGDGASLAASGSNDHGQMLRAHGGLEEDAMTLERMKAMM